MLQYASIRGELDRYTYTQMFILMKEDSEYLHLLKWNFYKCPPVTLLISPLFLRHAQVPCRLQASLQLVSICACVQLWRIGAACHPLAPRPSEQHVHTLPYWDHCAGGPDTGGAWGGQARRAEGHPFPSQPQRLHWGQPRGEGSSLHCAWYPTGGVIVRSLTLWFLVKYQRVGVKRIFLSSAFFFFFLFFYRCSSKMVE